VPTKVALIFPFPVLTKVASMDTMAVASPVSTKAALMVDFLVPTKVALTDTMEIVPTLVMKWRATTTRGVLSDVANMTIL
jgi:hypothetical protein